jgi:hypothetical protein
VEQPRRPADQQPEQPQGPDLLAENGWAPARSGRSYTVSDNDQPTAPQPTLVQAAVPPSFGGHAEVPRESDPDTSHWAGGPIEPAEEDLDLLEESHNKPGRLTIFLAVAILAAVAFIGGVAAQKHWGGTSSTAAGGFAARAGAVGRTAGRTGGFGEGGGFGGAGGFEGGTGGFTGQAGTGAGAGGTAAAGGGGGGTAAGGGTASTGTPVVVGTVSKVSGTTITVKNFAGKSVTVKVPASASVTVTGKAALKGLKAGESISVVGTKASSGTVTATSVTARP